MADAFETALTTAQTDVLGYVAPLLAVVGAVSAAFVGVKWLRLYISRL
jgi:hypothetical protein